MAVREETLRQPHSPEYSSDELVQINLSLLRSLLARGLISRANLRDKILAIGFKLDNSWTEALGAAVRDSSKVDSLLVPLPNHFSSEWETLNLLAGLLRSIEDKYGLIALHDPTGNFIRMETERQTQQLLIPGGQRIVTVSDERFAHEPGWHRPHRRYHPNVAVHVFTNGEPVPKSPVAFYPSSNIFEFRSPVRI